MSKRAPYSTKPPYNYMMMKNNGQLRVPVFIGTATLGLVRMEWAAARFQQVIPCCWAMQEYTLPLPACSPIGFTVADAQNIIVTQFIENSNCEWCFKGDIKIETNRGMTPIKDIQVGDLVRTHLGRLRPVTKTMSRHYPGNREIIWVETAHSRIKCTPQHPVFVACADERAKFVEAGKIRQNDFVVYPTPEMPAPQLSLCIRFSDIQNGIRKGSKKLANSITSIAVDQDIAWWLGLYLAQGSAKSGSVVFTINRSEEAITERVRDIAFRAFGRQCGHSDRHGTRQIQLSITQLSKRFREWFGTTATTKRIPEFVFNWPLQLRTAFLVGFADGDGTKHNKGWMSLSTSSQKLAEDLQKLALGCRICVSKVDARDESTYQKRFPKYQRADGTIATYAASCGVNFRLAINKQEWGKVLDINSAVPSADGLMMAVTNVSAHRMGNSGGNRVYNLEVAEDNSYIAGPMAVHNCLLNEDDNILPPDAFLRFNHYMKTKKVPIVSGLYFLKSHPSEPVIYRGRGEGAFEDFKIGDKVWVDGVPTGVLLIHRSILEVMWKESEKYRAGVYGIRRVFYQPEANWFDPLSGWHRGSGTTDLEWCSRIIMTKVFERAGWPKYQKMKYPFLVDTNIFSVHIGQDGTQYPIGGVPAKFQPKKKPASRNGRKVAHR